MCVIGIVWKLCLVKWNDMIRKNLKQLDIKQDWASIMYLHYRDH